MVRRNSVYMLQKRLTVTVDRLLKQAGPDIVCKAMILESNLYSPKISIGEK